MTKLILILVLSLFIFSCTRSTLDVAKTTIVVPSKFYQTVKGYTTELVPAHIVVNVTGPGISNPDVIYYSWDACNQGACTVDNYPSPPQITLEIPVGDSRLFQVLFVLATPGSDGGGAMTFKYGDVMQTVNSSTTSVDISVTSIGGSLTQADFAGRYVFADGFAPSGKVKAEFTPPNRRPMLIMEKEMFNGWFNFFALDGANFRYVHKDTNRVLFEALNANYPINATDINKVKFTVPKNWRVYKDCSSIEEERTQSDMRINYVGFWGEGASNVPVCYDGSDGTVTSGENNTWTCPLGSVNTSGYKKQVTDVNEGPSNISLMWYGTNANSSQISRNVGGVNKSDSRCSTGTAYVDYMPLYPINASWGPSAIGVKPPFQAMVVTGGGSTYITTEQKQFTGTETTPGDLILSWKYLPGVVAPSANASITGVIIYSKSDIDFNADKNIESKYRDQEDGYRCNELKTLGFTERAVVPSAETYTISGLTMAQVRSMMVIACPYYGDGSSRKIYNSALNFRVNDMGSMGTTIDNTAAKVKVFGPSKFVKGTTCFPYNLQTTNSMGMIVNPGSGLTVTLKATDDNSGNYTGNFYLNSDCASGEVTTEVTSAGGKALTLNNNGSKIIYYKNDDSDIHTMGAKIYFETSATNLSSEIFPINVKDIGTASQVGLFHLGYHVPAVSCIPIDVYSMTTEGYIASISSGSMVINFETTAGAIYSDAGCLAVLSSVTFIPGTVKQTIYFSMPTEVQDVIITAKESSVFKGKTVINGTMLANHAIVQTIKQRYPSASINLSTDVCLPIDVKVVTSSDGPTSVTGLVTLSSTSGTFFSDDICTNSVSGVNVTNGQGVTYFKTSSTSDDIQATFGGIPSVLNFSGSTPSTPWGIRNYPNVSNYTADTCYEFEMILIDGSSYISPTAVLASFTLSRTSGTALLFTDLSACNSHTNPLTSLGLNLDPGKHFKKFAIKMGAANDSSQFNYTTCGTSNCEVIYTYSLAP